ncbi:MAG: amino acid permease [Acidobacteria bacterium]|nr:amino acid permease [Acidobacteriota bacterium]
MLRSSEALEIQSTYDRRPPAGRNDLVRSLGLTDVVLMTLVGVVSLRWTTRAARVGAPSVALWVLAWLTFFLPLATAVRELSRRYPDQGGIYAWARRAFGPVHGFVCGWCLWVNNLFWFPSLLLFAASNAMLAMGHGPDGVFGPRSFPTMFVLAALWSLVGLNVWGLSKSKWFHNVAGLGTWLPAAMLIGFAAFAWIRFGSATSFAPGELIPRHGILTTISLWSAVCFAFSGLEVTSLVGGEVRSPRRNIPTGVMIAGLLAAAIYVAGSVSVLVSVPASILDEQIGIADAVGLVSGRIGLESLGPLTAALLALGSTAMANPWFAGAARVPFAAGVDRVFPAAFARLHPRYRTPHVVLVTQGIASSGVFLVSLFFTVGSGGTTVQEAYDIMVNLTILVYFIPYLYLFASLARLSSEGHPRRVRLRISAGLGAGATAVSLCLLFVPPPGTDNVLNYEVNLLVQAALILSSGLLFYRNR